MTTNIIKTLKKIPKREVRKQGRRPADDEEFVRSIAWYFELLFNESMNCEYRVAYGRIITIFS